MRKTSKMNDGTELALLVAGRKQEHTNRRREKDGLQLPALGKPRRRVFIHASKTGTLYVRRERGECENDCECDCGPAGDRLAVMMTRAAVMFLGTWPTFFFSFLSNMYLYDHMTPTHMTAYLYNKAILSGTPLFPLFVRFPLFSPYGSL